MSKTQQPSTSPPDDVKGLQKEVARLRRQLTEARQTILDLRGGGVNAGAQSGARVEMRALSRQIERQAMILERDNTVARKLQESLKPMWMADFDGVDYAVESVAGERVGGDFCDVIKTSESTVGLLIADVTGHGLPAAVIMALARMAFRTFASIESSPRSIMDRVNQALLDTTLAGHHLTAFLGLLDTDMLTLQYVNASHCPPYLVRDGEITQLDTEGYFVGMFDEPQYEQKTVQLEKDDKLFLFTDGLIRSASQSGGAASALETFLCVNAGLPIHDLVECASQQFLHHPEDDVAMLGVELRRHRAETKTITITSVPTEMSRLEDTLLPTLAAQGYGERALFGVKLALEEAVMNAIKHGNELDPTKKVQIEFTVEDDRAIVSVEDEGGGFHPEDVPDPTVGEALEASYGRGLVLMRAYMDSVEHSEAGNKVTMVKHAPWHVNNHNSDA